MEDDTWEMVVNQILKKGITFSIKEHDVRKVKEMKNEIQPISSSVAGSSGQQDEALPSLRKNQMKTISIKRQQCNDDTPSWLIL